MPRGFPITSPLAVTSSYCAYAGHPAQRGFAKMSWEILTTPGQRGFARLRTETSFFHARYGREPFLSCSLSHLAGSYAGSIKKNILAVIVLGVIEQNDHQDAFK